MQDTSPLWESHLATNHARIQLSISKGMKHLNLSQPHLIYFHKPTPFAPLDNPNTKLSSRIVPQFNDPCPKHPFFKPIPLQPLTQQILIKRSTTSYFPSPHCRQECNKYSNWLGETWNHLPYHLKKIPMNFLQSTCYAHRWWERDKK